MKSPLCAAWFARGGNASYFPALLFARVGAEAPRYPRPLLWLPPLGEPGAFLSRAAPHLRLGFSALPDGSRRPEDWPGKAGHDGRQWDLGYFSTKSRANALMAPITSRTARWRGLSWRKTTANLR